MSESKSPTTRRSRRRRLAIGRDSSIGLVEPQDANLLWIKNTLALEDIPMKIRYDAEVDAFYIELRELKPGTAECRELTPDITADYGPDGKLAGLEILDASEVLGEGANRVILELAPLPSPQAV